MTTYQAVRTQETEAGKFEDPSSSCPRSPFHKSQFPAIVRLGLKQSYRDDLISVNLHEQVSTCVFRDILMTITNFCTGGSSSWRTPVSSSDHPDTFRCLTSWRGKQTTPRDYSRIARPNSGNGPPTGQESSCHMVVLHAARKTRRHSPCTRITRVPETRLQRPWLCGQSGATFGCSGPPA